MGSISDNRTPTLSNYSEPQCPTLILPCPLGTMGSTSVVRSPLLSERNLAHGLSKVMNHIHQITVDPFAVPTVMEKKHLEAPPDPQLRNRKESRLQMLPF